MEENETKKYVLGISKSFNFKDFSNINKIKYLMRRNRGYITTKEVSKNRIARDYLKMMVDNRDIRNIYRGIYIDATIKEDLLYSFQMKFPRTIFSHFTSLELLGLIKTKKDNPYFTCVNNVFNNEFKECNAFYVKKEWFEIGLSTIIDEYGYLLKIYDAERSICDIIRSRKRLDLNLVKKCVRKYMENKENNFNNLIIYSKEMGIYDDVIDFINLVI